MKILITDCDHPDIDPETQAAAAAGIDISLAQCRTEDAVIEAGQGFDALVVQDAPITARVLDALPSVKAIGRYGVGVDTVDVDAATDRGVAVCNVPDYGTEAVSDHAIALMLATIRGLRPLDTSIRVGNPGLENAMPIRQFSTLRLGVLGFGRIGQATARKAAGLGMEIGICDVLNEQLETSPEGWKAYQLDELLEWADVLTIHTPLDEKTRHLIDERALSRMKPGTFLINTARGGVVDTTALVAALESGHLGGAGLDVFEEEPLPADHPLTKISRCILTPHAAFYTEESYAELKRRTVENVVDVLQNRQPRNILNPEVLEGK